MDTGSPRGSLPAELSGFVGRRAELRDVSQRVLSVRLVTLTGPGGVGKSRLALRVAHRLERRFADGAWLVELAELADPDLLAATVAAEFGVVDRQARSDLRALTSYLRDRRLLLLLDNCEHLLDGCAVLVNALLTTAPGVHVLATSRQPLGVRGELVVVVTPLSTPDPEALPPGDLTEFEAVRLLVERARAVVPDFAVTPINRAVLAALCRQLDGLPLAIELAAARLRAFSAEQLLARLDDRFRFLTKAAITAPPRHQTLRAALDWSYRLCSPGEQAMWGRVSVFAGRFDLAAAERVCADEQLPGTEVASLVTGLVDKSVLTREPGSPPRYGMLETVRQYGHERLAAAGQETEIRARHTEYYRRLVLRARAEFFSPRQVEWWRWLERERPNLRVALEFCFSSAGHARTGLEISVALRDFWSAYGSHEEGRRWLSRALALNPEPTPMRAVALAVSGFFAATLGDREDGRRMLAATRELADRLADPAARAAAGYYAGLAALLDVPADLARASALIEQGLSDFRSIGDQLRVAYCLLELASIAAFTGDPRAISYAQEGVELCEANGSHWLRSWGSALLAMIRWRRGDREQVAELLREALRSRQLLHDPFGAGLCLEIFAWRAATVGRHERAARLLGAGQAMKRLCGTALAEMGPFAEHHQDCVHRTRLALGEEAFTAEFAHGAGLSYAEAVELGLAEQHEEPATADAARQGRGPLTGRQRQIAELVAQGLTNREIAARLVISHRTAETHIEQILGRLGFTRRAQIADWVKRGHER